MKLKLCADLNLLLHQPVLCFLKFSKMSQMSAELHFNFLVYLETFCDLTSFQIV